MSALQVKNVSSKGLYPDGAGLYLQVSPSGAKSWVYRYQIKKRPRMVGLGSLLVTSLGRTELTIHGFRSTFRDWVAEKTDYPRDVAEMALAHTIGDKVEAAYRRGELIEKRARLMQDWADYCCGPDITGSDPSHAM